jgi:hypothetical protein
MRRRRRRRTNNVGLITRQERKVYLWGEWRREREGKKREGGREGRREREREREGMHGTQCKSAESM